MEYEIKDFIGVFHNVVEGSYCEEVIQFFEKVDGMGGVYNRQRYEKTPSTRKDNDVFHTDDPCPPVVFNTMFHLMQPFVMALDNCYKIYRDKYGILEEFTPHRICHTIQMQRVRPAQGYHVWHCENSSAALANRVLVPIRSEEHTSELQSH